MAIVDQFGNPFVPKDLTEPQTAHLDFLRSEYENHPSRGLTPPGLARILQQAEQGDLTKQHELFADMEEKDGHLFSELQKRRLAIQTLEWSVKAPDNATPQEQALADYVAEVLCELADFEDMVFDMTDAVGHGFSPLELTWQRVEKNLLPVKATHRPQGWFKTPTSLDSDRNELRLRDASVDGEALWPFAWLLHRHQSRSGYVSRSGLFRVLAWPFIFKNYAVRDLAEFLEIYGLPLRVGTYGPAATKEDKATLLRAVTKIGHDAAAIIPAGMMIDFKAAAQGDNKSYDAMIGLMERTMSKAILGGTLTSGEGTHGSQALGNVHNEVRHELKDSDARQIGASLTRHLVYPIVALNKGVSSMRRCPRIVFDTQEPEDVKIYADAVPKLVGMGMRINTSWAHDKLKIPMAAAGDKDILTLPRPEQTLAPEDRTLPKPGKPGAQRIEAQRAGAGGQADELDDLAAGMVDEWQEAMGDLVQPVRAALAAASSLEEFSAALDEGLAAVDPVKLRELLSRGAFAARVWGQLNATSRQDA